PLRALHRRRKDAGVARSVETIPRRRTHHRRRPRQYPAANRNVAEAEDGRAAADSGRADLEAGGAASCGRAPRYDPLCALQDQRWRRLAAHWHIQADTRWRYDHWDCIPTLSIWRIRPPIVRQDQS